MISVALTALARRQHRVVGREQLRRLGLTDEVIKVWVQGGRLHRIHRGVYAVGPPPLTRPGEWMAAALAGGPSSLISRSSAAALWGLTVPDSGYPHVTVEGPVARGPRGIVLHRTRDLPSDDRSRRNGIPVTSIPRTLVDQAAGLDRHGLRRLVEEADRLKLLRAVDVVAVCRRSAGRRGIGNLRAVLADYTVAPDTHSELEDLLVDLCRDFGIEQPGNNVIIAGWRVDAVWEEAKLAVELDGYGFHHDRGQFHRDREKGLALAAAGYELVRLSRPQLRERRRETATYLLGRLRPAPAGWDAPTSSGSGRT